PPRRDRRGSFVSRKDRGAEAAPTERRRVSARVSARIPADMSATNVLEEPRLPAGRQAAPRPAADTFAWRVLILLNLFRLATAAILLVIYYVADEPRIVGQATPELAWRALVGLFGFGCLELVLLQRRFPSARLQTYMQFAADLAAITLLLHASGGVGSGLGGLLIVSVGGLALLVA